jgi:hypothetical protein
MSIPLDHLYDYLESLSTSDILIYRFYPHGSKNLANLKIYNKPIHKLKWLHRMTSPLLVLHDQEPLQFDYYTTPETTAFVHNLLSKHQTRSSSPAYQKSLLYSHNIRSYLDCANGYDYIMLCHSEKNSKELEKFEQNGFVGIYYWSHAVIARDWYRFAEHDPNLSVDFNRITTDFLVYNRAWTGTREYRLTLSELIANSGLPSHCNMKFSSVDNNIHYVNHKFLNPELAIQHQNLESIFPTNTADSNASANYSSQDYQSCAIELVLETLFDDSRLHLTEKSLRPIACNRPFILAAPPGSLQYLRDYGFETFQGLIDETYDTINDPLLRLTAIVKEMQRIANLDLSAKIQLWHKLYQISQRNQQRFFSKEFHNFVTNEYVKNFNQAMTFMNNNKTGKYYRIMRDNTLPGDPLYDRLYSDTKERTVQDIREFYSWIGYPFK